MNEQKVQLPITQEQAQQMGQGGAAMTTDDMAAMLGFITSIGQMQHQEQNPEAQTEEQGTEQERPQETPPEPSKQPQDESPGEDKARDEAMQKEIEDIRSELEKLQKDGTTENDTTGKTTEDTATA